MQSRLVGRCPEHQSMTLHQGIEGVIATTNHACDWDLTTKAGIKYEMIAVQKSSIALSPNWCFTTLEWIRIETIAWAGFACPI